MIIEFDLHSFSSPRQNSMWCAQFMSRTKLKNSNLRLFFEGGQCTPTMWGYLWKAYEKLDSVSSVPPKFWSLLGSRRELRSCATHVVIGE